MRLPTALSLLVCLSACSALGLGGGSDSDTANAPPSPTKQFLENLALGGPPPATPAAPAAQTRFPDAVKQQDEFDCPILDISANGAALRDFAGGPEAGAQNLRHQISITNIARECRDAGANINMKLGVEGSVLLGPAGSPGTFTVPIVFEARVKDKVVTSRREALSVTIPPNETRAFFNTVVTDFVIPKDDETDVFVGLSQGGERSLRLPAHKRRKAKS
ncbi:MAG: hypothetical protein JOY67_12160 [Hyphomicrobiales bacterium]|nr:hypothetical protein [Hyphomicrobiales bacterium]MBV9520512.1 hypothetical protein [Hyphomicrobiales bacterium]